MIADHSALVPIEDWIKRKRSELSFDDTQSVFLFYLEHNFPLKLSKLSPSGHLVFPKLCRRHDYLCFWINYCRFSGNYIFFSGDSGFVSGDYEHVLRE